MQSKIIKRFKISLIINIYKYFVNICSILCAVWANYLLQISVPLFPVHISTHKKKGEGRISSSVARSFPKILSEILSTRFFLLFVCKITRS